MRHITSLTHESWIGFKFHAWFLFCRVTLQSNQTAASYPQLISATISPNRNILISIVISFVVHRHHRWLRLSIASLFLRSWLCRKFWFYGNKITEGSFWLVPVVSPGCGFFNRCNSVVFGVPQTMFTETQRRLLMAWYWFVVVEQPMVLVWSIFSPSDIISFKI